MSTGYRLLVFITGAMVLAVVVFNLYLSEDYPVGIRYDLPQSAAAASAPPAREPSRPDTTATQVVEPANKASEAKEATQINGDTSPAGNTSPQESPDAVSEEQVSGVQFPLDINKATQEEIMLIPGVGTVTAQRIVQYRDVLGGYTSLEQLMEIKGIGDGTYQKLWPYFIVEEEY